MKPFSLLRLIVAGAWTLCLVGCSKKETTADATQPLEQSFQTAAPEVKQAVDAATARLKAKDYAAAARALDPVLSGRPLTEPQRQAVGVALQQFNQAIAANPSLESKELCELCARCSGQFTTGRGFDDSRISQP